MSDTNRKSRRKNKLVPRQYFYDNEEQESSSQVTLKVEDIKITNVRSEAPLLNRMRLVFEDDAAYNVFDSNKIIECPEASNEEVEDMEMTAAIKENVHPKLTPLEEGNSSQLKFNIKVEVEECDDDYALIIDESDHSYSINDDSNVVETQCNEIETNETNDLGIGVDESTEIEPKDNAPKIKTKKLLSRPSQRKIRYDMHKISRTKIIDAANEILDKSEHAADKMLAIEVKNSLGYINVKQPPLNSIEQTLQTILFSWLLGKWKLSPLFYKCYKCTKAWWHYYEFKEHIMSHSADLKVSLEEISREECNIVAYSEDEPNKPAITILDACWKCGRPCQDHQLLPTVIDQHYECAACATRFSSCISWRNHMNVCPKLLLQSRDAYRCTVCPNLYLTSMELDAHYVLSHDVRSDLLSLLPTKKCAACTEDYSLYLLHMCPARLKHIQCHFCYRKFLHRLQADMHITAGRKPKRCRICDKVMQMECLELQHMFAHGSSATERFKIAHNCFLCKEHVNGTMTVLMDRDSLSHHLLYEHNKRVQWNKTSKIFSEKVLIPMRCLEMDPTAEVLSICANPETPKALPESTSTAREQTKRKRSPKKPKRTNKTPVMLEKPEIPEKPEKPVIPEHPEPQQKQEMVIGHIKIEYGAPASDLLPLAVNIKEEPMEYEEYTFDVDQNSGIVIAEKTKLEHIKVEPDIYAVPIPDQEPASATHARPIRQDTCKCGYTADYDDVQKHILTCIQPTRSIHEPVEFNCTKCNLTFSSLKFYASHLNSHEFDIPSCPKCLQTFDKTITLMYHIKKHLTQEFVRVRNIDRTAVPKFRCMVCKVDIYVGIMFNHWEKHLYGEKVKVEKAVVVLSDREKADGALHPDILVELTKRLQWPIDFRHKKRSRTCALCSREFARYTDGKRHMIEHLLMDAFANKSAHGCLRCQICGSGYLKQDHYRKHMRDHAALPIFQCELCDKCFSDSSNFTKHKKTHNLEVVICDICKVKFQAKKSLEKHLASHGTPLTCSHCLKVFYSASKHNKHVRSQHETQLDRFGCKQCSRRFNSLREKWDHLWLKHGERNIKADCKMCPQKFRNFAKLKLHMKEAHDYNPTHTYKNRGSMKNYIKANAQNIRIANNRSHEQRTPPEQDCETLVVFE